MPYKKQKGDAGEEHVCDLLQIKNHTILVRNYRNRFGEIDIISFWEGSLFFWEVKSWTDSPGFHPLFCLNETKQNRMKKLYYHFLKEHPAFCHLTISFGLAHRSDKKEVNFYSHLF